jgi:hypothetical protein
MTHSGMHYISMDDALLAAYRRTDYRVRLHRGGWASIRIDTPLPASLQALTGSRPWAVITAWNPRSRMRPREDNRRAQHALLNTLRAQPSTLAIHPACGVGLDGWHEFSLFVIGPSITTLDMLANQYKQNAYAHGHGSEPAHLRLLYD